MFEVLENGRPCTDKEFGISSNHGWHFNKFETLTEAVEYANAWLGMYGPRSTKDLLEGVDYSGYGDVVCIRRLSQRI